MYEYAAAAVHAQIVTHQIMLIHSIDHRRSQFFVSSGLCLAKRPGDATVVPVLFLVLAGKPKLRFADERCSNTGASSGGRRCGQAKSTAE